MPTEPKVTTLEAEVRKLLDGLDMADCDWSWLTEKRPDLARAILVPQPEGTPPLVVTKEAVEAIDEALDTALMASPCWAVSGPGIAHRTREQEVGPVRNAVLAALGVRVAKAAGFFRMDSDRKVLLTCDGNMDGNETDEFGSLLTSGALLRLAVLDNTIALLEDE